MPPGNLYIAERDNHVVRKVDAKTGRDLDVRRHRRGRVLRRRRTGRRARSCASRTASRSIRTAVGCSSATSATIASARRSGDRRHRDLRRHGRAAADAGRRAAAGHAAERSAHDGVRSRPATSTWRFGRATRSIASMRRTQTLHHVAGTGEQGYSGDGGPARAAELGGPEGSRLVAAARSTSPTPRTTSSADIDLTDRHHPNGARHRPARRRPGDRSAALHAVAAARRARRRARRALRRRQRGAPHPDPRRRAVRPAPTLA